MPSDAERDNRHQEWAIQRKQQFEWILSFADMRGKQ
jgi:hypothetical protein